MGASFWEKRIEENKKQAKENELFLSSRKVSAFNLLGSSGAGKTQLLRRTHEILQGRIFIQVVQGSPAAGLDMEKLTALGIPVSAAKEDKSGGYLKAGEIGLALERLPLPPGSLVFIENPGELFSPVDFELGENCRVLVHSVTEGDDKPLKFPRAYAGVDLVLLNKIDLLPFSDFSYKKFTAYLRQIKPEAKQLEVSCRTGVGLDSWRDWLLKYCGESLVEESG